MNDGCYVLAYCFSYIVTQPVINNVYIHSSFIENIVVVQWSSRSIAAAAAAVAPAAGAASRRCCRPTIYDEVFTTDMN